MVHISVDGLGGPYLPALIEGEATSDAGDYANYLRLVNEGSLTFNARTDFSFTTTLPNHASILTGRPVLTPDGAAETVAHGWTSNVDPPANTTLHSNNPNVDYISSVFDVVHDEGLSTALYATKTKFSVFVTSYNDHGAADTNATGGDNGTAKIDTALVSSDIDSVLDTMLDQLEGDEPANYTFFHSLIPDAIGHGNGWGSATWNEWIKRTDQDLGRIMNAIESSPVLNERTAIILTTDHGGVGFTHVTPEEPESYTIPFFVWGPGIDASQDLYTVYADSVTDPGEGRPDYTADPQPIRNGDSANLALELMGLPNIPGSTIGSLTTCDDDNCGTTDPPDPDPPVNTDGPPQVTDVILNGGVGTPNRFDTIEFVFDKDVVDSVTADDLSIRHHDTNQSILLPFSSKIAGRAEWRIEGLELEPGPYKVTLSGTGVFDTDGVNLDGNGDGVEGDSWQDTLIIAAPGDANVDGVVDTRDYQIVQQRASFGTWRDGDFDASGAVDDLDLQVWMSARFTDLRPRPAASIRTPQSALTTTVAPTKSAPTNSAPTKSEAKKIASIRPQETLGATSGFARTINAYATTSLPQSRQQLESPQQTVLRRRFVGSRRLRPDAESVHAVNTDRAFAEFESDLNANLARATSSPR